jgi:hypothetical protein
MMNKYLEGREKKETRVIKEKKPAKDNGDSKFMNKFEWGNK